MRKIFIILIALLTLFVIVLHVSDMFTQYCLDNKIFYLQAIDGKIIAIEDTIIPVKKIEVIKLVLYNRINADTISYRYFRRDEPDYSPLVNDSISKTASTFDREMFRNGLQIFEMKNTRLNCFYCN
jgi:hypothetical protein